MARFINSPWRLMEERYSGELHYMVVDHEGKALFDSVNRSPSASAVYEKNDMALAAAAPELLDALLALRSRHQIDDPHHAHLCDFCKLADAAIAKATGGQS